MGNKITFRTVICMNAWEYFKATGESWSKCMKKAWEIYRLRKSMRKGYVHFVYRKTNGSLREAMGTLMDIQMPANAKSKKQSFGTVCYFDGGKGAFRSFRVENLIGVVA